MTNFHDINFCDELLEFTKTRLSRNRRGSPQIWTLPRKFLESQKPYP